MTAAVFKTDTGKVRHHNEDSGGIFFNRTGCLAIVADGMGGHNAGEVASQMAVQILSEQWLQLGEELAPEEAESWFLHHIQAVNERIYEHSQQNKECEGMGTTIVAAISTDAYATVANIGDSRCYLLNDVGFKQLTEDHSFVNELIKTGQISPEDAELHPRKNVLLKAIGTESIITMDIRTITFEEGDQLLLCSDGLSNKVSTAELADTLKGSASLQEKADTFIEMANQNGGEDNISLAIIEHTPCLKGRCD